MVKFTISEAISASTMVELEAVMFCCATVSELMLDCSVPVTKAPKVGARGRDGRDRGVDGRQRAGGIHGEGVHAQGGGGHVGQVEAGGLAVVGAQLQLEAGGRAVEQVLAVELGGGGDAVDAPTILSTCA